MGEGIGHAGDFENGDMSYAHAGTWAKGRIAAGVSARSSISRTADATQWGSPPPRGTLPPYAGRNIDVSMTSDTFFHSPAAAA